MTEYSRINLVLPEYVDKAFAGYAAVGDTSSRNQLMVALYEAKWTLESIAASIGNISRERVRQIIKANKGKALAVDIEIPEPPKKPAKPKHEYTEPKPEVLNRLLELQPLAQSVRSNSAKFRAESEEYSALIHKANVEDGVSIYRLAKRLGITHGALQTRLVRYGYKKAGEGARSRSYNPIKPSNRLVK